MIDDQAIHCIIKTSVDLSGRPKLGQSCTVCGLKFQVIEIIERSDGFAVEWKRLGVIQMFMQTEHNNREDQ
jgi:hypothetical protein